MKILKTIFAFIWALWGFSWFMLVVSIFTVVYALVLGIRGKKFVRQCIWINCHYLSPFLMKVMCLQLITHKNKNVLPEETYVFVANHRAQVDIIAGASALPQPVKFLAKAEIKFIPFFGFMVKMLAIMVDRKSKESREKSMQYMVNELHTGNSIFIYPEGTRNRTDALLKDFKDGAFKLAIMAQVPIVVQTLKGTREINDPRGIHLLPGNVEVYFSNPISTKGMTAADVPALKETARLEMLKHLMN
jgi:1-acyl-sn-glycerol-3-phosphate acyltransferase